MAGAGGVAGADGLRTGEAQERDGDYFGPSVNRAARLMAVANGGQIVMSSATADMVEGRLTDGVRLTDLGERELRGVARPERVFGLVPGAPVFESATTRVAPAVGNLPRARQALLGREREVETVCGLLGEGRPVGGFHPGVAPQTGVSQEELMVRALSLQDCLLLLDNCEHVLDGASALAEGLLARGVGVRVLATSREGLGVVGERIVAVRPLAAADAVRLFHARAADHDGGPGGARSRSEVASASDDALVLQVCERLDGLPLAVELAAPRARSMPLADLAARLGEGFRLLRVSDGPPSAIRHCEQPWRGRMSC